MPVYSTTQKHSKHDTVISSAAFQQHLALKMGIKQRKLVRKPINGISVSKKGTIISRLPKSQKSSYFSASLRSKLPSISDKSLLAPSKFESREVARKKREIYESSLTLAQKMSLVPRPAPLLTATQWDAVLLTFKKRCDRYCSICLCKYRSKTQIVLPCSHSFHLKCLSQFERIVSVRQCPLCRADYAEMKEVDIGRELWHSEAILIAQSAIRRHLAIKKVNAIRRFRADGGKSTFEKMFRICKSITSMMDQTDKEVQKELDAAEAVGLGIDTTALDIERMMGERQQALKDMYDSRKRAFEESGIPMSSEEEEWLKKSEAEWWKKEMKRRSKERERKSFQYSSYPSHLHHSTISGAIRDIVKHGTSEMKANGSSLLLKDDSSLSKRLLSSSISDISLAFPFFSPSSSYPLPHPPFPSSLPHPSSFISTALRRGGSYPLPHPPFPSSLPHPSSFISTALRRGGCDCPVCLEKIELKRDCMFIGGCVSGMMPTLKPSSHSSQSLTQTQVEDTPEQSSIASEHVVYETIYPGIALAQKFQMGLSSRNTLIILSCGHFLHSKCIVSIEEFIRRDAREMNCPVCRKKDYSAILVKNPE
ncbi:RING finger protein 32 like protein [Aduncisulcus paluster]|uniref:RING finger protein 32 like protein n=1 Tax=Aduncisulcus paluster TaxID=2918883 RepID=A0ABQ5KK13_9EUKA|nr:RING finger protein 32 like protein [Aduncisulcus paluster]